MLPNYEARPAKSRAVWLAVAAIVLAVGAFGPKWYEPADEKAARLRGEMERACALSDAMRGTNPQYQAECDVATRKFNKFMGD